jgi:hypothetical protein
LLAGTLASAGGRLLKIPQSCTIRPNWQNLGALIRAAAANAQIPENRPGN